jgi:ribonuclease Z
MNLTVMGSSSGWAVPHRNAAGYLITTDRLSILLDAGEGIVRQLIRFDTDLHSIQAVFISHTHADHASGILMLLQRLHLSQRTSPLRIYLPEGVLPGFVSILPFFHIFPEKWSFNIEFSPLSNGSSSVEGDLTITPILNGHLQANETLASSKGIGWDSYSFRVDSLKDPSVLYTSDIDSLDHLESWTDGVELLLVECTHIPVDLGLRFALTHGIPRIVFTHIPPEVEDSSFRTQNSVNKIDVTFAEDGLQISMESNT